MTGVVVGRDGRPPYSEVGLSGTERVFNRGLWTPELFTRCRPGAATVTVTDRGRVSSHGPVTMSFGQTRGPPQFLVSRWTWDPDETFHHSTDSKPHPLVDTFFVKFFSPPTLLESLRFEERRYSVRHMFTHRIDC